MPSAGSSGATTGRGTRYRVKWHAGGREDVPRLAGTFQTAREAKLRRDWVAGELASMRDLPNLTLAAPVAAPTLREVAERWLASRIDVADHPATAPLQHEPRRGPARPPGRRDRRRAPELVAPAGRRGSEDRERSAYRARDDLRPRGIDPNPARDKRTVKLPKETSEIDLRPPTTFSPSISLPSGTGCRPVQSCDNTGMSSQASSSGCPWGDMDEPRADAGASPRP